MKIGVNARFLGKPFTGIGQYTLNLMRELTNLGNEYVLAVPEKVPYCFGPNVEIVVVPELAWGTAGIKKTWWEQVSVPRFFAEQKVDVAFFPYPANPWRDWDIKTVVTVHDVIPWIDKCYRRGILSALYHGRTKNAVKRADKVLTVSKFSAAEIKRVCGVKAEVINNAAAEIYGESFDKKKQAEVLKRFSLEAKKYFLYVGGYDKRKNVDYLLKEFANFEGDCALVLAGGKQFDNKLYGSFNKQVKGVLKTGFLDEESLAILYKNCRAFVNVSGYEGFNLPIVEAAEAGAPLILSDTKVHREVALDGAHFVDISAEGALTKAFEDLMSEANYKGFKADAKKIAGRYSWEKAAKKFKDVLT